MVLSMTGQEYKAMFAAVISNFITIVAVIWFGLKFGINGVALTWGMGYIIYSVSLWYLVKKEIGINTFAKFQPNLIRLVIKRK